MRLTAQDLREMNILNTTDLQFVGPWYLG